METDHRNGGFGSHFRTVNEPKSEQSAILLGASEYTSAHIDVHRNVLRTIGDVTVRRAEMEYTDVDWLDVHPHYAVVGATQPSHTSVYLMVNSGGLIHLPWISPSSFVAHSDDLPAGRKRGRNLPFYAFCVKSIDKDGSRRVGNPSLVRHAREKTSLRLRFFFHIDARQGEPALRRVEPVGRDDSRATDYLHNLMQLSPGLISTSSSRCPSCYPGPCRRHRRLASRTLRSRLRRRATFGDEPTLPLPQAGGELVTTWRRFWRSRPARRAWRRCGGCRGCGVRQHDVPTRPVAAQDALDAPQG